MQLLDRTTGQTVDVPDDQLQGAFQSGQYAFIKGDSYAFPKGDGGEVAVDATQAAKLVGEGAKIDPTADVEALERQQKYGDQTNALGEGSRAFLNTVFLGAPDAAALAAAEALGGKENRAELAEKMQASEEQHQIAHYAGTGAGFVLPLIATGGASALVEGAEGASALSRGAGALAKVGRFAAQPFEAVSAAGGVGESIAKALVGEASENVVARVLQKGLAKGAGAAIEASIFAGADQLHEDALGDHELNGEKLAGAMGHGALFGAAIGGGFGAAGEALSSGARWALTNASPAAKAAAESMAVKSLSYGGLAPKKFMQRAEGLPGGIRGLGRELLDRDLIRMGDTVETMAPRLRAAADDMGQGLTGGLSKLGATFEGPKTADIAARTMKEVESKFSKHLDAGAYTKVEQAIAEMGDRFPTGDTDMLGIRNFRRYIDEHISWNPPAPGAKVNPIQEALRTMRGVVEDELEKSIDKAGVDLGGDALKEYKALKLSFRRVTTAADMAEDAVTRTAKNQTASVSEKMISGLGVVHGLATGNPLAVAGGLAAATAHHAIAARGASTGAVALNKLSTLTAIRKTVESIDSRSEKAISGFLEGKSPEFEAKVFKSAKARDEAFDTAARRVKIAASDPVKAADSVLGALGGATVHADKIADSAMQTAARGAAYLSARVPGTPPTKTITPQFEHPEPTPDEKMKFLRSVRAVDDPLSVLDDMQRGRLTREGVDALKNVYPKLYEKLQEEAITRCADAKKKLSYDQKIQLGMLLEVPTDATLDPGFIARMQALYDQPEQQQHVPKRPLAKMETSTRLNARQE